MEVVYACCAGLDVHKATVVACVRVPGSRPGERRGETKTFATTTGGLAELGDWLRGHGVTEVAMESTGVYWRPVYAGLETRVRVMLVNARHVKMVPGRKTEVRGLRVAGAAARMWPAAGELRAPPRGPGPARFDPPAQGADPGARPPC